MGVSGLADWVQDDLFSDDDPEVEIDDIPEEHVEAAPVRWHPGMDVHHAAHGDGWVWAPDSVGSRSGSRLVGTPPGPVHTFRADDPALGAGHTGTFQT
ncbi:hypothetical protein [Aeromicrobium sp. UC242_57]|uniref:hypothetical protein n=1 Tax=Aeromicrobium sp. UC242_57 TaxID=3374624 RepID=UPI0037BB39E3